MPRIATRSARAADRIVRHVVLGLLSRRMLQPLWGLCLATALLPAQGQEVYYIHTDALGSPVAETDANRNVVKRYEYEPYGRRLNGGNDDKPGYTGHVMDAATGLVQMQQRYYDPGIGLFLSIDPVTAYGNTGGNFNRYWYANNNPYRFTDPDGRWAEDAILGVPSIVMGAKSFVSNVREGNVGAAVVDAVGVVADAVAIATPGVPGGAGAAIGIFRGVDKAADAGRAAEGLGNFKKISDSQLKRQGVDAHAVKKSVLGDKANVKTHNISADKDGNVILTPVKKGGEVVETGLKMKDLPSDSPKKK